MEIVFLDLETQKSDKDVGGWDNVQDMLVSVVVTFCSSDERYHVYEENDLPYLFEDLKRADLIVGYNINKFDYTVLSPYSPYPIAKLQTLDMMEDIGKLAKRRVKLDNLAKTTLGASKTADGLAAIKMFREGNMHDLIEYCAQDVLITRDLFYYGAEHGKVYYTDRYGKRQKVIVEWRQNGR